MLAEDLLGVPVCGAQRQISREPVIGPSILGVGATQASMGKNSSWTRSPDGSGTPAPSRWPWTLKSFVGRLASARLLCPGALLAR